MQTIKQTKRLLAASAIFYFAFQFRFGWVFLLFTFAEEINDEFKNNSWLAPSDWENIRGACVVIAGILTIAFEMLVLFSSDYDLARKILLWLV